MLFYISRGLLWAGETEGDRVASKYSLTMNARFPDAVLFLCLPFPTRFSSPDIVMVVNAQGPGCLGFLPHQHRSLLTSAERGICCVESVVFPLWSGFHL